MKKLFLAFSFLSLPALSFIYASTQGIITTVAGNGYQWFQRGRRQRALGQFTRKWKNIYPRATARLLSDEIELLAFFQIKDPRLWPQVRTTNAIERKFEEVRINKIFDTTYIRRST